MSWWQQFTGEAIVGDLTGTQLDDLSPTGRLEGFQSRLPQWYGAVQQRASPRSKSYVG
ncbi:MAG: DUF3179 domain-containing protein [Anaerolineales bacterium]|nr:DUF3179 domain-containing protein [Anaerolineales bacterium]